MIYKLINIEQRYRALKKHSLLSQINVNACVSNLKQKYVKYLKEFDIDEIRYNIHLELLDEIDYLYYNFNKLYTELRKNHLLNKANRNKINLREKYNNYQFNFNNKNLLSKIIFEEIYSMINFKHMDYENILIHGKKFDYITYLKTESTTLAHQKNLFHGNEYKTFFKKRFLANAREQRWVLDNENC